MEKVNSARRYTVVVTGAGECQFTMSEKTLRGGECYNESSDAEAVAAAGAGKSVFVYSLSPGRSIGSCQDDAIATRSPPRKSK